jgi:nucleotide-binding universal stress UspA family protein
LIYTAKTHHMSANIIIPVDFTKAAEKAAQFAIGLNSELHAKLTFLHIIDDENDRLTATASLSSFVSKLTLENMETEQVIMKGKFLEDIGKIADASNADLVVMGTHGERGMQKVFGSFALKVVESSKRPLFIVQEESEYRNIKTIIQTIDLEKESVQIVRYAAALAERFKAKVLLVGGKHDDSDFKAKVNTNMLFCIEQLKEKGVDFEFHFLERKNFDDNLIAFCKEKNADLLAATHYQSTFYAFSDKFVQHLIMNELHIPILTVESAQTTKTGQFGAMFG